MAFVLERISEKELKEYGLFQPEKSLQKSIWSIDRDANAYLVFQTRDVDSDIRVFLFFWKNNLIVINLLENIYPEKIIRHLRYLLMPDKLKGQEDIIKQQLSNALESYGSGSLKHPRKSVVENIREVEIIFKENTDKYLTIY